MIEPLSPLSPPTTQNGITLRVDPKSHLSGNPDFGWYLLPNADSYPSAHAKTVHKSCRRPPALPGVDKPMIGIRLEGATGPTPSPRPPPSTPTSNEPVTWV